MIQITNKKQHLLFSLGVILIILVLDQISKKLILNYFSFGSPFVFCPFINIILAWNPGVGFGLLKAGSLYGTIGLIILAFGISGLLLFWLIKTKEWMRIVAISGILGGAIGNLIDRIRFGAVVDFIDVHAFGYHWPTFNIADSAITCGITFLILENLWEKDSAKK